jgi:hypothetical protein
MKKFNFFTIKSVLWIALFLSSGQVFSANDKYRIILLDDPATTITIGWNQISGDNPVVYYDVVDHGTDYTQYAFNKSVDRAVDYKGMNNNFARLSGLTPNTAYYFVIHDSEGTSDRYWFRTAPDDMSRLSIIAGGDSRTNREPRQRANLLVSKLKPHAVLFGGDMTEDNTSAQWQDWLDDWQLTIASDGRMFPIIPAMGNHESLEVIYYLFDTPSEQYYYAITFGNNLLRSYTLNTEVSVSGNQLTWLKEDLNNNSDVVWKMAQYHKPMRPHYSGKHDNDAAYDAWAQLFFDNSVRLVVECDAHVVKETWPIEPSELPGNDDGFVRNDTYGTVYVGEGGWGAPLRNNNDDKSWTRNSGKFYQFKLIFVDENKIEVRTIKTDNAESVGEVSNDDPFTLPDGLDVWDPSNGDVVEILQAPPINRPDIEFPGNTQTVYTDGTDLTFTVEVISEGNGIDSVSFYVNNILAKSVFAPPYSFTQSYADGQYFVKAVAFDNTGLIDKAILNINVGTYSEGMDVPVKNGQDDIEETEAGVVYFNSSDLEMVFDDYDFVDGVENGFQKIGLRFQHVFIPQGAVIDSAFIQFRSDETDDAFAEFLIYAENSADAQPFDDGGLNVSSRDMFSDSVYWTPPAWTQTSQIGPAQRTPDVGALLQNVIDRNGWNSGNDVVFKIVGTGVSLTDENAIRVADSYEGKPSHPPTLICYFSYDASFVGVKELQNSSCNVNVFPNPFNDRITLNFSGNKPESVTVTITDILGKTVYSEQLVPAGNTVTIHPAVDTKGFYIVRVASGDAELMIKKMIKR